MVAWAFFAHASVSKTKPLTTFTPAVSAPSSYGPGSAISTAQHLSGELE